MPDARPEPTEPEANAEAGPASGFGPATAAFVIVSSMIGVGVLTTPGLAVDRLGSNQLMLVLWLVGGAVAACGALSLAEVSAALPRSGGEYAIFREAYGPLPAFLAGWVSFLFGFAAPIAVTASIASGYLLAPFGGPDAVGVLARPIVATALIVAIAAAHASGRGRSARLQGAVTLLEIAALVAFVAAGLWAGRGGLENLDDRPVLDAANLGRMAFTFIYVMYGYTGWNAATYLAGEVSDPGRNLPRAIVFGTTAVTVLYLGISLTYALALPASEVRRMAREGGDAAIEPIAQVVAHRLFGATWADGLTIGVGLILVATLSASLLTGPRVLFAMARDGQFLAVAGRISNQAGTPATATVVLAGCGIALLWTGSFDTILVYSGVGLAMTSILAVASVIVLRHNRPRPRPAVPCPGLSLGAPVLRRRHPGADRRGRRDQAKDHRPFLP